MQTGSRPTQYEGNLYSRHCGQGTGDFRLLPYRNILYAQLVLRPQVTTYCTVLVNMIDSRSVGTHGYSQEDRHLWGIYLRLETELIEVRRTSRIPMVLPRLLEFHRLVRALRDRPLDPSPRVRLCQQQRQRFWQDKTVNILTLVRETLRLRRQYLIQHGPRKTLNFGDVDSM